MKPNFIKVKLWLRSILACLTHCFYAKGIVMKFQILIMMSFIFMSCAQTPPNQGYEGFGRDSLSEETLLKFAPKALDEKELIKIQKMLDVRAPNAGIISPDGKTIFAHWSVSGTNQVWKIPGAGRFPIQMSGGNDATSLKGITPDGKYLVLSRDSGGDEMPGIYLQSTEGGSFIEIYRKEKTQSFVEYITDDSKYLYFRANDQDKSSYSIYKYELATRKVTEVFNGQPSGYWVIADRHSDGTLLLANWKSNTASEYFLYTEKEKKLFPVLGQDEAEEYSVRFGRNKNELLITTNKFGEFRRLYTYDILEKLFEPISENIKHDIQSVKIDRSHTRILYEVNEGGYFRLKALDFKTLKSISAPKINSEKLLQVYYGSTSFNGRYTTLKAVFTNSPGTTYVYDWKTKKLVQWTTASVPEVNLSKLVVPRLEHYVARDGTKIPMFVQRPKICEKKTCPVVIDFHGGPESQSYPWFIASRQLYLEEGFIYVEPNVRGSDGFGKSWLHSDNGPKRLKVITDIEDAALFVKKQWAFDGKTPKVAAMGGSYGGYSAFAAMTMFAGSYDAGIAIVGMSDLVSFLKNTADYRRKLRESEYGYLDRDMEALKKLSPINYLDKIQDPLLIIHGANDPRVPAGEAVQIFNKMEAKGLKGELILFADEGHGVRKRENKAVYLGHILKFLKTNLKD